MQQSAQNFLKTNIIGLANSIIVSYEQPEWTNSFFSSSENRFTPFPASYSAQHKHPKPKLAEKE